MLSQRSIFYPCSMHQIEIKQSKYENFNLFEIKINGIIQGQAKVYSDYSEAILTDFEIKPTCKQYARIFLRFIINHDEYETVSDKGWLIYNTYRDLDMLSIYQNLGFNLENRDARENNQFSMVMLFDPTTQKNTDQTAIETIPALYIERVDNEESSARIAAAWNILKEERWAQKWNEVFFTTLMKKSSHIFYLYEDNQLVGCARVLSSPDVSKLLDYVIVKNKREKHYGTYLLRHILYIDESTKNHLWRITSLEHPNFYLKSGFQECSPNDYRFPFGKKLMREKIYNPGRNEEHFFRATFC